jgi:hypothetical protein
MALESATYLPELTNTNPVGATDPKSEGDDHIRLLKKVILNSFGGFVGTAGTPKSVTLTEDEINDAAQKAAVATISALWDFTTEPTLNGDIVGRQKLRKITQNGDYEFLLTDAGKMVVKTSGGGGETFTIPADSAVDFLNGDMITVVNLGGGDLSIAITDDTLQLEGSATTGTRTLADDGICTLLKISSTKWFAMGGESLT